MDFLIENYDDGKIARICALALASGIPAEEYLAIRLNIALGGLPNEKPAIHVGFHS